MSGVAERLGGREHRDYVLAVGGLALFVASLVGFGRMEGEWADFPAFLLLAVPCAVLLGLAVVPERLGARDAAAPVAPAAPDDRAGRPWRPWRVALALAGLVLLGFALAQLTLVLGDEEAGSATGTWVFAAVGVLAVLMARETGSRGATFLACLAFGAALISFADWVGDGIGVDAFRDLLLALGLAFLLAARLLRRRHLDQSHLLVAVGAAALLFGAAIGAVGEIDPFFFLGLGGAEPEIGGDGWELILIAVSIGALAYAAREAQRGPAYVGVAGLITFAFVTEEGSLAGWPLVLAVLAVLGLGYGLLAPGTGEQAAPDR